MGHHCEEDDREYSKVKLSWLEKRFFTLIELVTQLLVMKGKEAHSTKTKHEEHKASPEGSKGETLGKSGNDNTFSSSSNVPFKVEVKLEISMYDGQTNVEVLDSWLKQLEVYFRLYRIQETQHISFTHLKMTQHALL